MESYNSPITRRLGSTTSIRRSSREHYQNIVFRTGISSAIARHSPSPRNAHPMEIRPLILAFKPNQHVSSIGAVLYPIQEGPRSILFPFRSTERFHHDQKRLQRGDRGRRNSILHQAPSDEFQRKTDDEPTMATEHPAFAAPPSVSEGRKPSRTFLSQVSTDGSIGK